MEKVKRVLKSPERKTKTRRKKENMGNRIKTKSIYPRQYEYHHTSVELDNQRKNEGKNI